MLADNSQEESTRKRRSNSRDSHGSTRPGTESDSTISLRQGGLLFSSVLSGIFGQLLQRLQSVFSAAARLVFSARNSDHITPLLSELHWLKVPERIQFRLCVLAYHCLIGTSPSYLAETLHSTADVGSRRRLRSASTSTLVIHTDHTTHHAG